MIHNVTPHHTDADGATGYFLSLRDHTGAKRPIAPEILHGNPAIVKALTATMTCKTKFVSGVLAFAERYIPKKTMREILSLFFYLIAPGIGSARLAKFVVLHQSKGGVHMHYLVVNIDLQSGKRLNAYYHPADGKLRRAFCQFINDRYGFADPNDPARWRLFAPSTKNAPVSRRAIQEQLHQSLGKLALAGTVRNRQDIETALTQAGWQISRRTRTLISVSHSKIKFPVRLKGRMFSSDWAGGVSNHELKRLAREFQQQRSARMRETAADLLQMLDARSAYNHRRFGGKVPKNDPLRKALIEMRDAPQKTNAQKALAELQADIQRLRQQLGDGVPLTGLTDRIYRQLTEAHPPIPVVPAGAPALSPIPQIRGPSL